MSTELMRPSDTAVSRYEQKEVIETIRQTVAKGATDAQLKMFCEVCKSTGLNPFLKEIWYVAEKGIIMAGRDGYLCVANEHPAFDGMETRSERDDRNVPVKAVCTVWRKDRNHPIVCEAYYSEYNKQSPVWRQYPSAMIGKVAEVLALKRSFSINGVVTEEEIGDQVSGSREQAHEIAQRKIEAMRQAKAEGRPVAEVMVTTLDSKPVELQLHDDIVAFPPKETPKARSKNFDVLRAFADLKKRYRAIGKESAYYAGLGRFGVEHSNKLGDVNQARACYKEMSLNVADLEAWVKQHPEEASAAN